MNPLRLLSAALLLVALAAGAGTWLQRQSAAALRSEIALLRDDHRELLRLREENARLKAAQPGEEPLRRLQADHEAVIRLRAEIDSLRARADALARENARAASAK